MNRKVPKIVVGVDGSEGAAEALRWALGEARLRRAKVLVVHAWTVPLVLSVPSDETFGVPEAANDADILVVGSRGLGGFTGLLLGSVSQQCAHNAPCPLVIVPPSNAR